MMKYAVLLVLLLSVLAPQSALAAVSFRAASAKAGAITGANPVGLPSGVAANDIVILVGTTIAGGSLSITTNGSITTWNAVPGTPIDVTSGEKLYVWWGRYSSGSTGPSITPGSDHSMGATFAYSGAYSNVSPIDVSSTGSEITSDTSFSFATGISSSVANTLDIVVYTSGTDSNTGQAGTPANTSLTSVALRAEYETTSGGGGGAVVADGLKAVAGTLGTWTDTMISATPKAYVTFNLKPVLVPIITTQNASGVGETSATFNGSVTSDGGDNVTTRGFAWGTNSSLSLGSDVATTTESGIFPAGAFTDSSEILVCNTTYYYRPYATNALGTSLGTISGSFVTSACSASVPVVSTSAGISGVSSATLNGNITATGGVNPTERGFAWGTSSSLSGGDTSTTTESGSFSTGAFSQSVSNLLSGVTYYFRAYATNSSGTGYGSSILNITTSTDTTPSRRIRLFEGYRIKIFNGRIILNQK